MNNHTISISVTNEPGVLSRIVDLFSGRGFNIESLTVAPTMDGAYSRVTIVTQGDNSSIEQITKQLNRLIPILKVIDLTVAEAVETEVALVKVHAKDETRAQILNCVATTGAKIVDVTDKTYTIQIVGDTKQINALLELLKPIGIKEMVRSGKFAASKDVTL